jgi:hypothetical protein
MLHLALVFNVMTAIGAAPPLSRPNFPRRSDDLPGGVQFRLCRSAPIRSRISCIWNGRRAWSAWMRRDSCR